MIKTIGIIFIILGSMLGGWCASNRLATRLEELKILRRIFIYLKREIQYAKTTLPEALNQIGKKVQPPFSEFLIGLAMELEAYNGKGFHELFQEGIALHLHKTSLQKQDLERLAHVGAYLGFLDTQTQIQTIDLYLLEVEEEIKNLTEGMPAKQKVCKSLGIMGGLFLTILIL